VQRTSRWGNPFVLDDPTDDVKRADVIGKHREWLLHSDESITVVWPSGFQRTYDPSWVRAHVHELRGFDLACSCAPKPCHADVLLGMANA
jgi:hypothetical protein